MQYSTQSRKRRGEGGGGQTLPHVSPRFPQTMEGGGGGGGGLTVHQHPCGKARSARACTPESAPRMSRRRHREWCWGGGALTAHHLRRGLGPHVQPTTTRTCCWGTCVATRAGQAWSQPATTGPVAATTGSGAPTPTRASVSREVSPMKLGVAVCASILFNGRVMRSCRSLQSESLLDPAGGSPPRAARAPLT